MRGLFKLSPGAASVAVYTVVRAVCATLRWNVIGAERIDALIRQNGRGVICTLWHGRTFLPVNFFRHRGYWSMISTSRDGDYQDRIFRRFGFQTVRGSSSARGAVQATITLLRHLKSGGVLAHTPDGPRGPANRAQPGAIYLAMKSGCPILPVGVSAAPRTLLRSWDRYMIPNLFSRAVILFGEPIYVPADARSETDQQLWADRLTCEIDTLEREAERLSGASTREDC